MMANDLKISTRSFLIVSIVYLASPYYIYWSRTLMLETTALFFSLCWLAFFVRSRSSNSAIGWSAATVFGIIGCLAKSTTFIGVSAIGGMIFLYDAYVWIRVSDEKWRRLVVLALLGIVPMVVGYGWVIFSDAIKSANPYSFILNSNAMLGWNLGSVAQRWLLADPITISLRQTFGPIGLLLVVLIMLDFITSTYRAVVLFAIIGYLIPFLFFSNLHIVHDYYQVANALFMCIAVGLTIASIIDKGWFKTGVITLALVLASQAYFFRDKYWYYIANDNIQDPVVLTAKAARDATKENESILFFGDDWSSVVPFYSERKSLGVSSWTYTALFDQIINDTQTRMGPSPLGAIVDCRQPPQYQTFNAAQMAKIDAMIANRQKLFESGRCRLFSAAIK